MSHSALVLPTPAERARAALRYLAQRRLSPTPDHYRRAWNRIGGDERGADDAHGEGAEEDAGGARIGEDAGGARVRDDASGVRVAEEGAVECERVSLGPIVAEAMHWVELAQRNWTRARKREALQRVLGRPSDAATLGCRLASLVESWKRDESDCAVIEVDVPTADRSADAQLAAASESAPASRNGTSIRRLLAEMTQLLITVCETVPRLVEEEAWVRRQFDAIRATLDPAGCYPDRRDLALARDVLCRTAEEHQRLLEMRRGSLQMMKSMLEQCVDWLRTLTESSDRFGGKLSTYLDDIRNASDLPTLAGVVHQLIEETRSIYTEFDASRNEFAAAGERARQLQDEVERLAGELDSASALVMTDHLTQLLNRRGFDRSFAELSRSCRSAAAPLSVALIDVDDFKKLNDAHGHQRGDEALRHLAQVLRASLRPSDVVARYGGEEFVVLLPSVPLDAAVEVIRRAQRALTNDVYLNGDQPIFVTFSAGVAQAADDEALDAVVERADEAMYRAKRTGKNRVLAAKR